MRIHIPEWWWCDEVEKSVTLVLATKQCATRGTSVVFVFVFWTRGKPTAIRVVVVLSAVHGGRGD